MSHPFSFKREAKIRRSHRVQVILNTLGGRYKDRHGHRSVDDAINDAALQHLLSLPEISGDVPPEVRRKTGTF